MRATYILRTILGRAAEQSYYRKLSEVSEIIKTIQFRHKSDGFSNNKQITIVALCR